MTRAEALARLRAQIDAGRPIIGAGAGTGLSAKCAEAGGCDLIIIYNSGRYRMAGRGSLAGLMPYGDANAIVVEMAAEVLPVVKETPVLAGVCGTDPFRLMPVFLEELKRIGFSGVQNFPTVGLIDGNHRIGLEETGHGLRGRGGDDPRSARARPADGALRLHAGGGGGDDGSRSGHPRPAHGLTTGGAIGASTAKTLDESVGLVQAMRDAAVAVREDVIVLCHGGPIAEPDDAAYVLERDDRRRRVLRRLEHGAAADGDCDDGEHATVQGDHGRWAMIRFVMNSDVPVENFDWGSAGCATRRPGTGCQSFVVMDVRLDPGFFHAFHKHPDQDEMITIVAGRSRSTWRARARCSGPATRSYIDKDVVHGSYNDFDEPAQLAVVLAPAIGDGGYVAVDVSAEEPWVRPDEGDPGQGRR